MSLRVEVITEPARLEELRDAWDELAVAARLPFCAPGWLLPWWYSAAPAGARLHAVAAFDGERLVALAPLFLDGGSLLPLGTGATTRVEPVAAVGLEAESAQELAPALAESGAALLRLAGIPERSPWPELLAEAWPGGRAWLHEDERMPAPAVELEGLSFDDWLASRTSTFRKQFRRFGRRLEDRGGRIELAHDDAALAAFVELHRARWAARGGSGVLDSGVEAAVAGALQALPPERFRLFTITAPEGTVAAGLFVAAGGEVSSWLSGHDDRWGDLSPQILLTAAAIGHAIASGDRRLDLGAGAAEQKERVANGGETLRWVTLVPPGRAQVATRLRLLPGRARLALSQRLSDEQKRRVKRLLRRPS